MKKTVYAGLLAVQRDLKAPKNQFNSFGKYKYRSCEDILSAARPLCNDNGLVLVLNDEPFTIDGWHYIEATATVIDVATGDSYSTRAVARESAEKKGMDDSQITGATSSYARKYALCALFAIDDTKDFDSDVHGNASQSTQKPPQEQAKQQPNTYTPKTNASAQKGSNEVCAVCGAGITPKVAGYSRSRFGKPLCMNCQKKG